MQSEVEAGSDLEQGEGAREGSELYTGLEDLDGRGGGSVSAHGRALGHLG